MKLPMNYAILKHFTHADKASVDDVMEALEGTYGKDKPFTRPNVLEAIMTGETNGLLSEVDYDLDPQGEARIYYSANEEQRKIINSYIK